MASAVFKPILSFLFPLNKNSEITVCPLSNLDGVMNYVYIPHPL